VPLLAGCFSRYIVRRIRYEYRQSGGITTERAPMIFGWVDDPNHPAVTTPTSAALQSLEHNLEVNAWEDFDMEVRVDQSELLYSKDDASTISGLRNTFTGALIGLQRFSSTPAVVYGTMYVSAVIDLYDFSPIYSSVSSSGIIPQTQRPAAPSLTEDDEKSSVTSASDRAYALVPPPAARSRPK